MKTEKSEPKRIFKKKEPKKVQGDEPKNVSLPEQVVYILNKIYYILKVHDELTRKQRNTLENPTIIRNIWPENREILQKIPQ